jgi:branched-chain amino acid transport system substrate-binding protein
MNPTAVKEATKIGFPMDHLVGVWWSGGDDDARPSGAEAKGYSSLDLNGVGANFPALQDILKYVVSKGKSQVSGPDKVGENLYNRAVMNSAMIAEAIRTAQQLTGKKVVNAEDVRRGFEALNITEARWKEMGFPNFASPVHLTCADHNGHSGISLVRWDGTKWETTVPSIQPIKDKVLPLINSAAEEYVKANTGWPKRTEPCDKSS